MKPLLYLLLTATLFACNDTQAQKGSNTSTKAPPLYSVSDLTKERLNGHIKTAILHNYHSVEMVNNQWVPTRNNETKYLITKKHYDQQGFIQTVEEHKIGRSLEDWPKSIRIDSFYYLNKILTHSDIYVGHTNEDGHTKPPTITFREIYYWSGPYTYKTRWLHWMDGSFDSLNYRLSKYLLNNNYQHIKIELSDSEDTNKISYTALFLYDKDYTTKKTTTPGGKPYITETILKRDAAGNPVQVLYIGEKEAYTYNIAYEYYQ